MEDGARSPTAHDRGARQTTGGRGDPEIAGLEAFGPPGAPCRRSGLVPDEALSVEEPIRSRDRRGQLEGGVGQRLVVGRTADLDHLRARRALEDAMADPRRLQDRVAGLQHERPPLVLVDDAEPSPAAVDHLEPDAVEVNVVRHRAAIGNGDVRGDEAAALPIRNQVSIAHSRPSHPPRRAVAPSERERRAQRRQAERRVAGHELDARAVGSQKLRTPVRAIITEQADDSG
jgi:hypothetical protein